MKSFSFARFVPEYAAEAMPFGVFRTIFRFTLSPRDFLMKLQHGALGKLSRPAPFLIGQLALLGVVAPFTSFMSDPTWAEVVDWLPDANRIAFLKVFELPVDDADARLSQEWTAPGTSVFSKAIAKSAGSLDLDAVVLFVAMHDRHVAESCLKVAKVLRLQRQVAPYLWVIMTPIALAVGSLVSSWILQRVRWKLVFQTFAYYNGLWSIGSATLIALRERVLPWTMPVWVTTLVLMIEATIIVVWIAHLVWLLRLLRPASFGRRLLSATCGLATGAVPLIVVGGLLVVATWIAIRV